MEWDRAENAPVESGGIFRKSDGFVARHIAAETIIVPVRGNVGDLGSIYTLNELGSCIWRLLDQPKSLSDIVALVLSETDVDAETAGRDAREFLDALERAGIIRES